MKYIRTKDGIFERKFPNMEHQISFDHKTFEPAYYTVKYDWIAKKDVIKQSDDIKELFDGYYLDIDNHPFNTTRIFSKNELQKAFDEKISWQNYFDRKGLEYEINLYGFIKTDKGFVFVAKINTKYVAKTNTKGDCKLL